MPDPRGRTLSLKRAWHVGDRVRATKPYAGEGTILQLFDPDAYEFPFLVKLDRVVEGDNEWLYTEDELEPLED